MKMTNKSIRDEILKIDKEIEETRTRDGHIKFFFRGTMIVKIRWGGKEPRQTYTKQQINKAKQKVEQMKKEGRCSIK